MKRKWPTIVLVILFALMAMGGSFTCFYHSGDDHATTRVGR